MNIGEIDTIASPASGADACTAQTSGETFEAPAVGWTFIKPGRPDIARMKRNQSETDTEIGSARLEALMPFALSQLGRPYEVWNLATGSKIQRSERLALKSHAKHLAQKLGCGKEFLYERLRHLCKVGPENARVSDLLKRHPGGGRGGCRLRGNNPEALWTAIEDVCVKRGLKPGTAKSIDEIRTYLAAHGWVGKLPARTTLRKHSRSPRILNARQDAYKRDHLQRVIATPTASLGLMSAVQLDTTLFTSKDFKLLVVDDQGHSMGPANVIFGLLAANRGVWTFLAFAGPANSYLAGLSIKRGLLSKEPLLRQYGLSGVWPYSGKVGEIKHDNGSEFVAEHLVRIMDDLDIGFNESGPEGTPHFRGIEERFNRTAHSLFNEFLESEQGRRHLRQVHGAPDAKGIRLSDLDRALMEWVVIHYHTRGNKNLGGDSPNSRFEKLVEGSPGLPASGLALPMQESAQLDWDFMCEEYRVVNHLGILWENRVYRSQDLSGLFALNQRSSKRRVPFRYNRYGLKSVFVKVPGEKGEEEIVEVPWVYESEKYPMDEETLRKAVNPSLWEWRLLLKRLRQAGHAEPATGLIVALHNKKETEAESNRKAGAPNRKERVTDTRNRGMRETFGDKNLPKPNVKAAAEQQSKSESIKSYQPKYLTTAEGHDAY